MAHRTSDAGEALESTRRALPEQIDRPPSNATSICTAFMSGWSTGWPVIPKPAVWPQPSWPHTCGASRRLYSTWVTRERIG